MCSARGLSQHWNILTFRNSCGGVFTRRKRHRSDEWSENTHNSWDVCTCGDTRHTRPQSPAKVYNNTCFLAWTDCTLAPCADEKGLVMLSACVMLLETVQSMRKSTWASTYAQTWKQRLSLSFCHNAILSSFAYLYPHPTMTVPYTCSE